MIVFSFAGEYRISIDPNGRTQNLDDSIVGAYTYFDDSYPAGTLLTDDHGEASAQDIPLAPLVQLAKSEVMRLYEEQVYGVENVPTDLVITEWREKETVALAWASGQLPPDPHPLRGGYRTAMIASLTQIEIAEFAAQTPALVPGVDDDAICDALAERVIGAATAKRVLLHFAGAQRRDANDMIDLAGDYLTLATSLMYIQQQVPLRTANFLAQFNP